MNIKDKVIYVSAPFGGKEQNKRKVEKLIKELVNLYPNYCFLSPIHAFGFLYNVLDYEEGMEHCYTLLDMCDEMWVFGDSEGVLLEKEFAKRYNIPIIEKW